MERTRKRDSPQTVSFLRERNALRRRVCPSRNSNILAPQARDGKPVPYGAAVQWRDGKPVPYDTAVQRRDGETRPLRYGGATAGR